MAKVYKTMRGQEVNMEEIVLKNEKTIAVGNMNVNARGDVIGPGGEIVKTSSDRVREQESLHTMVPNDIPVNAGGQERVIQQPVEQPIEDMPVMTTVEEPAADAAAEQAPVDKKPKASLAASVAGKKEVTHKQTETKPAKKKKGVKRI